MGILDKLRGKDVEEMENDEESSGGKSKQSTANEPDPGQGASAGEESPNPTKAAEDVD
jgi:hypothetical protein